MFEKVYIIRVEYFQADRTAEEILQHTCRRFRLLYSFNASVYNSREKAERDIKRFKREKAKIDLRTRAANSNWNIDHFYKYHIDELTKFF